VILVDWNMPKADGIKLLEQLRADNDFRDVYAIMVTARSEQSDIVEGIRAGADDYLTKPFDNEELVARVRVGLRTRGLQRELSAHVRRSTVLEMAGSIAHEIGNPLTAARLLQERLGNSPQLQQYPDLLKELAELGSELKRIEDLVRKAQSITSVRVIPYAGDINIIDLDGTGDSRSRH
jgi:sigma-B regulation protein RsbU (phosphoserine phosphatase)